MQLIIKLSCTNFIWKRLNGNTLHINLLLTNLHYHDNETDLYTHPFKCVTRYFFSYSFPTGECKKQATSFGPSFRFLFHDDCC